MNKYLYGLTLKPVEAGFHPAHFEHVIHFTKPEQYLDILAYNFKVCDREVEFYGLDFLGVVEK